MTLQGAFAKGSGNYTLSVRVLSPDGLTEYASSATSLPYFQYYFANNPFTGQHFFNARLKSFVPAMCTNVCYILHVTVTDGSATVFEKYTERYCQSSCCDLARNVTIAQNGLSFTDGDTTTTVGVGDNPKVTECGDAIITLRTSFDCYDKFTGLYFGTPGTTLSGTASFAFENISNFRGRVVRRPREISREYSYNCRLQRVESTIIYRLEGFEFFPAWKMNEIEAQLHSTRIYVDDTRYEYSGGTPFNQINDCFEVFKLDAVLNDCAQRQVFGCDTTCEPPTNFDGAQKMYVIPERYEDFGFYSEDGVLIAEDYEGLLLYFRNLSGVTEVNEIDVDALPCSVTYAFSISGEGYIPTSFYYDRVTAANRVYSVVYETEDDLCADYPGTCVSPWLGTVTVEEDACVSPWLGSYTVEEMDVEEIPMAGYGEWQQSDAVSSPYIPASRASLFNYEVMLDLHVFNLSLPEDPGAPGDPIYIDGEIIAVMGADGRPQTAVFLDSSNSNMPEDTSLSIDINGLIKYVGYTTVTNADGSYISLTDLRYNTQ